ncbi:MAG: hypothetical protein ABIN95_08425 [Mucilaginibacter sp.]
METLKIDVQNEQEKKVLIAFLDSLHYQYRSDNDDYVLNDAEIQEMLARKEAYEAGNTTAIPWSEIKQRYEGV